MQRISKFVIVCLASCAPAIAGSVPKPDYPPAQRDSVVDHYGSINVPAPYQWMENMQSPALHKWVEEENALTAKYLAKNPLRPWMQGELKALWNYPKETAPDQVRGARLFYRRNAGLQNQSVLYVREGTRATPRVLIDPNKLSPDGSTALASYTPSPDGKLLAYSLSTGGSDWETLHVLNVRTGKDLPDAVHWVKFSNTAWTNDGRGFFYSRYPEPAKDNAINQEVVDQKIYYHRLGTPQSADRLVFERPDLPHWVVEADVSESGRYLFIELVNGTSTHNELFFANLGNPHAPNIGAKVRPLYTRNDAQYQPIGIDHGTLYLQTTLDAPRGRIVAAPIGNAAPAHWRVIVPQGKGVIQDAALAGGRLIVDQQVVATSRLDLYSLNGRHVRALPLPGLGSVGELSARNDKAVVYYAFTSFLQPASIYRYDIRHGTTVSVFKPAMHFDAAKYEARQVFYTSKDGTKVPMFIVARKNLALDGKNPTVLYGYGGFDITITPSFNPAVAAWLKLGGVYAVANLRGGGTYGEAWHRAGMLGNKQNVFNDFAAAARYLIDQKYTSPSHLGIQGYSNGGLLSGASITQHPRLFGAAYIGHGVLDMLRYQDFSGGALWAPEYGVSSNPVAFKWLIKYSPLQNIHPGVCYPPTLITTSWDDDRVVPMHEFKFTAAMQRAQSCANPILLYTTGATSHIYMPTDKEIAQAADVWAFEGYNLGLKIPPNPPRKKDRR